MNKSLYNGVELDIFDMYGIIDIRTSESNRIAQIFCKDRKWYLHLYWIENGNFSEHFETLMHVSKPDAVVAGKEWVVNGTHWYWN